MKKTALLSLLILSLITLPSGFNSTVFASPLKTHSNNSGSVIKKEAEEIKKFMKEAENPDASFEIKVKNLAKKFFSDTGLKIMASISLILSIIFFFRIRNYVMSIVFYVIANVIVFFGYKIVQWIFK